MDVPGASCSGWGSKWYRPKRMKKVWQRHRCLQPGEVRRARLDRSLALPFCKSRPFVNHPFCNRGIPGIAWSVDGGETPVEPRGKGCIVTRYPLPLSSTESRTRSYVPTLHRIPWATEGPSFCQFNSIFLIKTIFVENGILRDMLSA